MSSVPIIILLANMGTPVVICQINLGSFSLGQNERGDLKFIFNQAANILGFGGDRGLDVTIGEGRFKSKAQQGLLIGGQRIGTDSVIGFNEAEGVNLGNFLNFGTNPISFNNPAGQFLSFLGGIKKFFTTTGGPSDPTPSLTKIEDSRTKTGTTFHGFDLEKQRIPAETTNMNDMQPENHDYNDYYHIFERKNETAASDFKERDAFPDEEDFDMVLSPNVAVNKFNSTAV